MILFIPVLETAHREAVQLTVRGAVHLGATGVQVTSPRIRPRLNRRPEVAVTAQIVE